MELFVDNPEASVAFYRDILGFRVEGRDKDYVSMRRGTVVLGLGPVAKLPEQGTGPGFTRQRLAANKGAGVEIVLELDDRDGGDRSTTTARLRRRSSKRSSSGHGACGTSDSPTRTAIPARDPRQRRQPRQPRRPRIHRWCST
jgi:hypothetical protein